MSHITLCNQRINWVLLCFGLITCYAPVGLAAQLQPASARNVSAELEQDLGTTPPGVGLNVGDAVADFDIQVLDGTSTRFSDLLQDAPLLVIFYRGGWCPYCNFQIREMTLAYQDFQMRRVLPVFISADGTEGANQVQKTYEIPFPVMSDPGLAALTEFNIKFEIDDAQVQRMKAKGVDSALWSGQTHHVIAFSSAFILDTAGTVKWAHVSDNISVRPSTEQLLRVIDELAKAGEI